MNTHIIDDMKKFKALFETFSTENSVGMNPTNALSDKELNNFQEMPPEKKKIANPAQQSSLDSETTSRTDGTQNTDEGNEFSGAREDAIKAGKTEFTVDGKIYHVTGDKNVNEQEEDYDDEPATVTTPISQYKRKNVRGLYNYDHWEHPDGSFVQIRHGKPFSAVHQNTTGDRKNFNSFDDLKSHINTSHGGVPESVTTNQFEEPKSHVSHAAPNWGKEGTTSQNYSKGETEKWDSYMSNESADWDDMALEAKAHLSEKWGGDTKLNPKKKGMFDGKTKAELKKEYNKLKASGPHKKGSADNTKMKELSFAIRAKSDWGKVKEDSMTNLNESVDVISPLLDRVRQLSGIK